MSFKSWAVYAILSGLAIFSLLQFVFILPIENNANQTLQDSLYQNYRISLNNTLMEAVNDSSKIEQALNSSDISFTSGVVIFQAVGGLWRSIINVPMKVLKGSLGLLERLFGNDQVVLIIAIAVLIIVVILFFYIVKLIMTGIGGDK